jgi:hypothetical protein
MRIGIVIGSVFAVLVVALVGMHAPREDATVGSPAFHSMLSQALDRLQATSQHVAAATLPATQAGGLPAMAPTIDEYTCGGFRTCDAIQTCDGTLTCDGEITCWASTCLENVTCQSTCELYTRDMSETCEGGATCQEGCPGWPTYFAGLQTCDPGPTCEITCPGFITCSGCAAIEQTTWGAIKAKFRN